MVNSAILQASSPIKAALRWIANNSQGEGGWGGDNNTVLKELYEGGFLVKRREMSDYYFFWKVRHPLKWILPGNTNDGGGGGEEGSQIVTLVGEQWDCWIISFSRNLDCCLR